MRTTNCLRWSVLALPLLLSACQSVGNKDTIATLRTMQIEIKEEKIEGGLEKAMEGYRRFLEETPDAALKPEAIRRLADLKVEREYGVLSGDTAAERRGSAATLPSPERAARPEASATRPSVPALAQDRAPGESQADFEKRAAQSTAQGKAAAADGLVEGADDLKRAGALEAIELYKKLLNDYPTYERNDQVLYQMSRAYEELGQVDEAMQVMNRLVREYPKSRYMDEVQFRRAEYFFTRRHYLDAEEAYGSIVNMGVSSSYYQLALYKLGWTFYKQEIYDEALDRFIALLDYKVSMGYDFAQTKDEQEKKRIDDTFRVISLSFSNLGGANSVVEYFNRHGKRSYEDGVYSNLGEFYFDKRRYADAAATYNAFVSRNPFHKVSPQFHMRVIEIHLAGAFPSLVIDAKKQFVRNYGLKAKYWKHFEPAARPEVLVWLKTNLTDLAKHYHALYQSPQQIKEKKTNFEEALHWYREFLTSFPTDPGSPAVNYLLADLLLENRSFDLAAVEYEKTAYEYPRHEKSSQAGYAAIYAYRQHLAGAAPEEKDEVKREIVRSSLKFADTYPEHEKAAIVLGAAADDLYDMRDYEPAVAAARRLIEAFPGAEAEVVRAAWLVVGHSTYELTRYNEAETAYTKVLALLPAGDKSRDALNDNLAAAIYKQGEQANVRKEYRAAADHFMRVGRVAPTSKIRVNAEYDAAAALMQLKDWKTAATVLLGFRDLFPGHALQPEVTKKIAYVYKEDGQLSLAANEYERIERESQDDEVRREALLIAADLHEQTGNSDRVLEVYRRYVGYFPHPVEPNLETRSKIAEALKSKNDQDNYFSELKQIVAIDASAGGERTPRTRYIAGKAALVLAEQTFDQFAGVKLVQPFETNLRKKKELMKVSTQQFDKLLDYEVGEVTAAATFYLAEIYAHFSKDLRESERPEGLSALEREEYELAIEEQAYPFEEKAIAMHKSNLELINRGFYSEWIDKSLQKLAKFVPARYDKPEVESPVVASLDSYTFAIERPEPPAPQAAEGPASAEAKEAVQPKQEVKPAETKEAVTVAEPTQEAKPPETKEAAMVAQPKQDVKPAEAKEAEKTAEQKKAAKPAKTKKAAKAAKPKQAVKPAKAKVVAQAGEAKQSAKPPETKEAAPASGPAPETGDRVQGVPPAATE
jgi:outer membrane protein assembly factor BamD (BamD/ComL family)